MMTNPKTDPMISTATAYEVVGREEEYEDALTTDSLTSNMLETGRATFTVSKSFRHIPEARTLTWTDDFFHEREEGDFENEIIAVFDFDYDKIEAFNEGLGWVSLFCSLLYPPIFAFLSLILCPCFLRKNVQWSARAQHVAVTRDGIRFVEDRRKFLWGLSCMDKGKKAKTVPFDKITDCDIVEPAGNAALCCVPNILYSVHIDTASSNVQQHELSLAGLTEAHKFKKLVWAMKRAYGQNNEGEKSASNAAGPGVGDCQGEMLTLLREIRDELRQNNESLGALQASSVPRSTTTASLSLSGNDAQPAQAIADLNTTTSQNINFGIV